MALGPATRAEVVIRLTLATNVDSVRLSKVIECIVPRQTRVYPEKYQRQR